MRAGPGVLGILESTHLIEALVVALTNSTQRRTTMGDSHVLPLILDIQLASGNARHYVIDHTSANQSV